jgi:hypothetical protein
MVPNEVAVQAQPEQGDEEKESLLIIVKATLILHQSRNKSAAERTRALLGLCFFFSSNGVFPNTA